MKSRFLSFVAALLTGVTAALGAHAQTAVKPTDDSEIFYPPGTVTAATPDAEKALKPRVLLILDTSGSMTTIVPGTGKTRLVNMQEALIGVLQPNGTRLGGILNNPAITDNIQAGMMQFSGALDQQSISYPIMDLTAPAPAEPGVTFPAGSTVRERLLQIIPGLTAGGNTPIVPTLLEAANYLRGARVDLGRTNPSSPVAGRGISVPGSIAGAVTTTPATCDPRKRGGTAGSCAQLNGTPVYDTPLDIDRDAAAKQAALECRRADYVVFLTDGAPTHNSFSVQTKIRSLTGATSCTTSSTQNATGSNGQCGVELARWLNQRSRTPADPADTIGTNVPNASLTGDIADGKTTGSNTYSLGGGATSVSTNIPGEQWVVLHTIAFNLDEGANGSQYLQQLATAGGGKAYTASTAGELETVFSQIFQGALETPASFATPSLATNVFNSLFSRDEAYVTLFQPDERARWKGNVKKYRVCIQQPCNCTTGNPAGCVFGTVIDRNNVDIVDYTAGPNFGNIRGGATEVWNLGAPDGSNIEEGGAAKQLEAQAAASRKLYTFTGVYKYGAGAPTPDGGGIPEPPSSGELTVAANAIPAPTGSPPTNPNPSLTKEMFGLAQDSDVVTVMQWIRDHGQDTLDEDGDQDTTEPVFKFEDPFHASAVPVEYGPTPAGCSTDPFSATCAAAALASTKVFVPTNGGALRMLNGQTGAEEWLFIPKELLKIQPTMMSNPTQPVGTRTYGLDLTPIVWAQDDDGNASNGLNPDGDFNDTSTDFVRLIFGQRDGGRSYYALDVTQPAAPKLMWKIEGGTMPSSADVTPGFANLASTWSPPTLGLIKVGSDPATAATKTVLIFGGGNDQTLNNQFGPDAASASPTPQGSQLRRGNVVYIVDAETGQLLTSIGGPGGETGVDAGGLPTSAPLKLENEMLFPVTSQITAFDSNGDRTTDRLYFFDLGGNGWRVDLDATIGVGDTNPGTVAKIADLAFDNATGVPVPLLPTTANVADFRSFYFAPEVVQLFNPALGGRFDMVFVSAGHRAHPLDITVHNELFALKDFRVNSLADTPPTGVTYPLTRGDLADITDDLTPTTATLSTAAGWRLEFRESPGQFIGEKGVSKPLALGGKLFFTTYIPPTPEEIAAQAQVCKANPGRGRTYGVDLLTGAPLFTNWDGDTANLSRKDRYLEKAGMPAEPGVAVFPNGILIPGIQGTTMSDIDPGLGLPRGRIYWNER